MNKKAKARKGKGILDATANMVLSNKHNRLMSGEKHQIRNTARDTITQRR